MIILKILILRQLLREHTIFWKDNITHHNTILLRENVWLARKNVAVNDLFV